MLKKIKKITELLLLLTYHQTLVLIEHFSSEAISTIEIGNFDLILQQISLDSFFKNTDRYVVTKPYRSHHKLIITMTL